MAVHNGGFSASLLEEKEKHPVHCVDAAPGENGQGVIVKLVVSTELLAAHGAPEKNDDAVTKMKNAGSHVIGNLGCAIVQGTTLGDNSQQPPLDVRQTVTRGPGSSETQDLDLSVVFKVHGWNLKSSNSSEPSPDSNCEIVRREVHIIVCIGTLRVWRFLRLIF